MVDLPDILLPEDQYLDMFDSESDISGDNSEDELVEVLPEMSEYLAGIHMLGGMEPIVFWCYYLPCPQLDVCLGIPLAWWYGFHCFWTHPMVRLVVST